MKSSGIVLQTLQGPAFVHFKGIRYANLHGRGNSVVELRYAGLPESVRIMLHDEIQIKEFFDALEQWVK